MRDLLDGDKPLNFGVVGGSISEGGGATHIGRTDWFSVVVAWLASVTKAPIKRRNGSRSATPSAFALMCFEHLVDTDVDLVFIEYSFNDGFEDIVMENSIIKAKEQLIRRIMKLPRRPAVVLVQVPHVGNDYVDPFPYTMEDLEGALSAYYDVQSVSSRSSLFLLNRHNPTDGFLWNQTYWAHHPINIGHKIMADLAVHLLQEVAISLFTSPISQAELQWRELPLPVPMHEGNFEPTVSTCLVGDSFAAMAVSNQGWQWVNEGTTGKQKWGYVATVPGSLLVLRLGLPNSNDAASMAADRLPNATFPLYLHYLGSYASMGIAELSCQAGCDCESMLLDGSLTQHVSVLRLRVLIIRWARREQPCDLRVVVSNQTHSDGYKCKVSGAVFALLTKVATAFGTHAWAAEVR